MNRIADPQVGATRSGEDFGGSVANYRGRSPRRWPGRKVAVSVAAAYLALGTAAPRAFGQSNTRLLLSAGWGVPGHAGFAFGPFSGLAMNESREIVFLSSLRGARSELRAVVRSDGVSFSVVAFAGLRAPVPKTTYDSFSAPSMNHAGLIAFTAHLRDDLPTSAVIRVSGDAATALAHTGAAVPGQPDAKFQEFSPPVISSSGSVLFGARTAGKAPTSGLFHWTPQGLQPVPLPPELRLDPSDLLVPVFQSRDEAVFVSRSTPYAVTIEQFFRAVAVKNFQELQPPPDPGAVAEILSARPGEEPVRMVLVLMEGTQVHTAALEGDPAQPVVAKRPLGGSVLPLARIQGQTAGSQGNILVLAAPAANEKDLALFCYCHGELVRLTSPEEFLLVTRGAQGKPIVSLTGDAAHTVAFIAPNDPASDSNAIYVSSIP